MDPWIEKLSQNNPERDLALNELTAYLRRGLPVAMSSRGAIDPVWIDDITQNALLRILERLDSFDGRGKFTSWALALAVRVGFNFLRDREWKHLSLESLREERGDLPEETDETARPDQSLDQQELARLLREIIHSDLTVRQQDVILAALNGMHQEEIARQLGTSRNNVYKLYHDGRKSLRKALAARGHTLESLLGTRSASIN